MKRYQIIPHTADLRLRVYGKDLEELFMNGAYGLASVMYEKVDKRLKYIRGFQKISLQAKDTKKLFVNFLSELVTLCDTYNKIFPRAKILKISPTKVKAHVSGVEVDEFDKDIKAVSHHEVEIKRENEKLQATVILDV
ncbi:MAG: archease [Candidatus Magasanikbacteria bacterium]